MYIFWSCALELIADPFVSDQQSFLRNDEIAVYYEFSSDPQANAALVAFPKGFQVFFSHNIQLFHQLIPA